MCTCYLATLHAGLITRNSIPPWIRHTRNSKNKRRRNSLSSSPKRLRNVTTQPPLDPEIIVILKTKKKEFAVFRREIWLSPLCWVISRFPECMQVDRSPVILLEIAFIIFIVGVFVTWRLCNNGEKKLGSWERTFELNCSSEIKLGIYLKWKIIQMLFIKKHAKINWIVCVIAAITMLQCVVISWI